MAAPRMQTPIKAGAPLASLESQRAEAPTLSQSAPDLSNKNKKVLKPNAAKTAAVEQTVAEWKRERVAADIKANKNEKRANQLRTEMATQKVITESLRSKIIPENAFTQSAPNLSEAPFPTNHWVNTMIQSGSGTSIDRDSKRDQSQQTQKDGQQNNSTVPANYDEDFIADLLDAEGSAGLFHTQPASAMPNAPQQPLAAAPAAAPAARAGVAQASQQPAVTGSLYRLWRKTSGIAQYAVETATAKLGLQS